MAWLDAALEKGYLPEALIRFGIRGLLAKTLAQASRSTAEQEQAELMAFVEGLRSMPIAIETDAANQQHYMLPPAFFELFMGRHNKYSSGYWLESTRTLDEAEAAMLELTCHRAELASGQRILELGCGWGSLTLWMAEHYPNAHITALSNSSEQRGYIEQKAKERGLENITVITANIADFDTEERFDRVVSVEMFEHMKNYERLLANISRWLEPDGKLFVHIFTHQRFAYHYEDKDGTDWLTRYFFTGGTMPSNNLLSYFQKDMLLTRQWLVDGSHYQKTAEAWLRNFKANRALIWPILQQTYGAAEATKWWHYWSVFFMACAELWGYRQGREWMVSHYLFSPVTNSALTVTQPEQALLMRL